MLVRKTVTILFSDIVTSTELAERLDPESMRRVMSRYFDEMRAIVERHGGTVEKFIGDEVMAVFGVPNVHEDDALRAVRAAAEMRDRLAVLNEEFDETWGVRLNARTGVNTGHVVAGDPSAGGTYVTGDPVVLAKRLEQAAEPGQILIGKATYPLIKDAIKASPLQSFSVKGKAQPVDTHRLDEVDVHAPGIMRRLDAPLVGRSAELAWLTEGFDEAVHANSCRLLTVLGPAGIGKSRLAAELCETLGDRATWLTGRCLPYGDGITFWPLAQIVREAGGTAAIVEAIEDSDDADVVVKLIQGTIGPSPVAGGSDESFWAVRRFLEAMAASEPLVVCLEDIHWAERTFLDLIEYLAVWIRGAPILLLCLTRPELLETEPSWLNPRRNASVLALEPLSEAEADVLLDALRGDTTLSEPVRRRIAATSEGNPLFVEQMVAMAAEEGNGEVAVPPSIYALLAERLDRLGADERAVIERASIIGKDFVRREIVDLCPPELRPSVGRNLMALVRKDLIRPATSADAREDGFRFQHALIRDAAYEGLPKEIRAELHEYFAGQMQTYIEEYEVELDEIIGYHLEQAVRCRVDLGRVDPATDQLSLSAGTRLAGAARRAFARGDVPAARKLLERAKYLLDAHPQARAEVLLDLGAVAREQGDAAGADAVLVDAEMLAGSVGDERLRMRAEVERSVLRLYNDPGIEPRQVLDVAERATPVFEASGDQLGLSRAWSLVADAHWFRAQYGTMEEVLERARVYADRAGDRRTMSWILGAMCRVAPVGPLPVEDGIRRCLAIRSEAASRTCAAACRRIDAGRPGGNAWSLAPRTRALPGESASVRRARIQLQARVVPDVLRLGGAHRGRLDGRGAGASNRVRGAPTHGRAVGPLDDGRVLCPCALRVRTVRRGGTRNRGQCRDCLKRRSNHPGDVARHPSQDRRRHRPECHRGRAACPRVGRADVPNGLRQHAGRRSRRPGRNAAAPGPRLAMRRYSSRRSRSTRERGTSLRRPPLRRSSRPGSP